MKIAVIGDLFVRASLYGATLQRHVAPLVDALEIAVAEVPWPDTPLSDSDEVQEFLGDEQVVIDLAHDADVLVTHVAPVTQAVIDACQRLRIVGCSRGGLVNVNIAAATARGIPVVNAPGRNAQAVIEFTLGLILTECRGIGRAHKALSDGLWQGHLYRYDVTGRELKGQTIGLVGFGAVAQGLVPYLRPFGMRILAFDPYVGAARCADLGVEQVDLPTLLAEADIVSLHARVTKETLGMIGPAQFAQMKRGAYFINTARGLLVDHAALYDALLSGHLAGAGLDTFVSEPPPPNWPLLRLPNVTVTPHIAGASKESAERGIESVAADIAAFLAGRHLASCVNAVVLERSTS